MNQEESMKVFDLVIRDGNLPDTLEELVPLSFIGQTAVAYYREKVKLMEALDVTEEQRKATLTDGQDAGVMLLEIERRIGELLETRRPDGRQPRGDDGRMGGYLPDDLGPTPNSRMKRSRQTQAIHRHPEAVATVVEEAKARDEIPTKTAVLNRIRSEREKERQANAKRDARAERMEMRAAEAKYLNDLESWVIAIQNTPIPKDWTDVFLARARVMAKRIVDKLKVFDEPVDRIGGTG